MLEIKLPANLAPETDTQDAGVLSIDPWLEPFQDALKRRYSKAQDWIEKINKTEGGLDKFSKVSHPWICYCPDSRGRYQDH